VGGPNRTASQRPGLGREEPKSLVLEAVLGKSPLAYFQDLRVERAQSFLHGSGLAIDAIAVEYEDGATLRTLLRQRLGRGVRDLRTDLR
jgi:transcriptional regulator GlxA family with amidase domain